MKKILVLLVLLVGAYFALAKWSPGTLDRITFWKTAPKQNQAAPQLPTPELPPQIEPPTGDQETAPAPTTAGSASTALVTPREASAGAAAPAAAPPATGPAIDKSAQVVVFCYHRVEASGGGALALTPQLFEEHMQKLKDNGISVISMQDFLAWRRGEKSIPAKSALITIDDGYVSGYEVARPILKKFGYPFTVFVYTKYISSGGKSMTWEQLAEMRDEGVEIGSHTISHIALNSTRGKTPEAYEAFLQEEIVGSKKLLEQKLGIKCATFAYPEGKYSSRVLEVVKEAGYEVAFGTYGQRVTHGAPAYRIGRYAWYAPRAKDLDGAFAFTGPVSGSDDAELAQPAAATMITQPMDGEVVTDPRPVLKVNLATLGELESGSVGLRLSGVGIIPAKFDASSKNLEARPPEALKPGEYTATVSGRVGGKRVETMWRFTVADRNATTPPGRPGAANQ
jgi:peptidoglycan/xylan/chitin deacetylase (PgdA/CDA1 family)